VLHEVLPRAGRIPDRAEESGVSGVADYGDNEHHRQNDEEHLLICGK